MKIHQACVATDVVPRVGEPKNAVGATASSFDTLLDGVSDVACVGPAETVAPLKDRLGTRIVGTDEGNKVLNVLTFEEIVREMKNYHVSLRVRRSRFSQATVAL